MNRKITLSRTTNETNISLTVDCDGTGVCEINTGVGFFDHMLHQVSKHSLIDLHITCEGDYHIDDHHSVEDVGILLGQAMNQALGEKRGICRYGHAYVPLDEALSRVVVDLSGRSYCHFNATFATEKIGTFDCQLVEEFFIAFSHNLKAAIHADNIHGTNSHHIAETLFKALGRALRGAIQVDQHLQDQVPSSKGVL